MSITAGEAVRNWQRGDIRKSAKKKIVTKKTTRQQEGLRTHDRRVSQRTTHGDRRDDIDWKQPGNEVTHKALCLILGLSLRIIYGLPFTASSVQHASKHKVKHRKWKQVTDALLVCLPELPSYAKSRDGRLQPITTTKVGGRFNNMFHIDDPATDEKVWGMNDSENAWAHPVLAKYIPWADKRITEMLGKLK